MLERKKRQITARMVRRGSREEKEFDREFWKRAGHESRFAAAWEMVRESLLFKGETNGREPRLQRSVQTVQRGRS
ncbi:MAG: hypothetical protein JW838_08215, partial [Spirochaetes bacterium]|nr:hypothetical protein [Spirochaetota bacterium]